MQMLKNSSPNLFYFGNWNSNVIGGRKLKKGFLLAEEAAADDKRGKLYKPKSRFETQPKSILPLETPPQFLALDKRHVSTVSENEKHLV